MWNWGSQEDAHLTSAVQTTALGLVDEFVKAWASANVR
jgi:hypothetical protein